MTTGTRLTRPSFVCNVFGTTALKCILGSEVGTDCAADSDCTGGGAGSCQGQCFCPVEDGVLQQPNECFSACRGGANDYQVCGADSECPGGFCQSRSCRLATGVCVSGSTVGAACAADTDCPGGGVCGDDDSSGEGFCPGGPIVGRCSVTEFKGCTTDADCHSPPCLECLADDSETCVHGPLNCFVNEGYTRTGTPGTSERVEVAHYCVPPTTSNALNDHFPGPGALEQPVTVITTGP